MSRSIDLFIDAPMELADLAARIGQITGLSFAPEAGGPNWMTRDDGFIATLGAHPYVGDGHVLFSTYRYALSARVEDGVRPQDAAETLMMRMVAEQLQRQGGLAVLLVIDLQYRDAGGRRAAAAPDSGAATEAPGQIVPDAVDGAVCQGIDAVAGGAWPAPASA